MAHCTGIDWTSKVASAQVKSAILLAGLSASGTTIVREAVTTRTHTEEMLAEAGADLTVEPWGEGRIVAVRASALRPVERHRARRPLRVGLLRGGRLRRARERGRGRRGLHRAGPAGVRLGPAADGGAVIDRRPAAIPGTATIRALAVPCAPPRCAASEIPSLDEIPALAVAAAVAEGTTVFSDVGELRVKEVDRLAAVADMVEAFGATAPRSTGTPWPSPASAGPTARRPLRQPGRPPHGHGGRRGRARGRARASGA